MLTWPEFSKANPELAKAARRLIYAHGIGLGFLSTVRPDGGPRVHPMCPVFTEDDLFAMIAPGPKLRDLLRDPRYALCSETVPPPNYDDNAYITGEAVKITDKETWKAISVQMLAERNMADGWPGFGDEVLFRLTLDTCLVTLTLDGEDLPKGHNVWREDSA